MPRQVYLISTFYTRISRYIGIYIHAYTNCYISGAFQLPNLFAQAYYRYSLISEEKKWGLDLNFYKHISFESTTLIASFLKKMHDKSYRKNRRFQIEIDWVHNDENLLVLVREPGLFSQGGFAEILDPAVFSQKS